MTKHDILRDNNKTSCESRDPCSTESETTTAIRMNPERMILESTPITTNIRQISNDNTITTENIEQQIEQLAHFADRQEISHIASEVQTKVEITEETLVNNSEDRQEEKDTEEDTEEDPLFELEKEFTPPPRRRNPERMRKKSKRYGVLENNCIIIDKLQTRTKMNKCGLYPGMKLWQLSLLMICCFFIPFGNAMSDETTASNGTDADSVIQQVWQKISFISLQFFNSKIGYMSSIIIGYLIGIIIVAKIIICIIQSGHRQNTRMRQILVLMAIMLKGSAEIIASNQNLGLLFGPAHICGGSGHHALYVEIPDEITCKWTDPREPLIENVVVTTYFPKVFSEKISAHGCTVEIKFITTQMGFWGTKSILDKDLVYKKLDFEGCIKEVRHLKSKTGSLQQIAPKTWSNDSTPFEATFTWLTTRRRERYRLIIKEIEIKFNFQTGGVVSPDFQLHGCLMNTTYCEQQEVTVIWQPTEKSNCNLQEGKTVVAQRMRDDEKRGWMMTSDMGQFTLTGPLRARWMCGIPDVYPSDQGMFVKIRNITFSKTLAQKIRAQIGKSEGPTTTYTGLIAYVAHQLQDMMVELFKKNYLNICRLNQERIIYLHHLASQPNTAYLASRMLLKTQNVMGHSSGQLITTYQCDTIFNYYQQQTTQCYHTILVIYNMNEKNYTRYLLPSSMDLLPFDSPIPCDKPTNVFIKDKNEKAHSRPIYDGMVQIYH